MNEPISSPSLNSSDSTISISSNYESYSFTNEQKDVISNLLKLQDKSSLSIGRLLYNIVEIMRCLKLKIDFREEPKFKPLQTTGKFTKNEGIDMFLALVHDIESIEIKKYVKENLRVILKAFQSFPLMDEIKQAKYISSYWVFELTDKRLFYINSSTPSYDKIIPELYYNSKYETILYLDLSSMIIVEFKVTLNISPFETTGPKLEYAMVVHNDLNGIGAIVLAAFNNFPIDDVYICSYSQITKQLINKLQLYKHVIVVDLDFGRYTSSNMIVLRHNMRKDEAQDLERNKTITIKCSKNGRTVKLSRHSKKQFNSNLSQLKMNITVSEHCGAYLFYHRFIPMEQHSSSQDKFVQLIDIYSNWNIFHVEFKQAQALNFMFLRYIKGINKVVQMNIHDINKSMNQSIISPFYIEMFYNLYHDPFIFTRHQLKEYKAMKEEVRSFIVKLNSSPIESIKRDAYGRTYFSFMGRDDVDNDAVAHYFLNREGINIAYVIIRWQMLSSPHSIVSLRSQSFNLLLIPGFHGHSTAGSIKWKNLQRYLDSSLDIE